jgi:hypothetical protein
MSFDEDEDHRERRSRRETRSDEEHQDDPIGQMMRQNREELARSEKNFRPWIEADHQPFSTSCPALHFHEDLSEDSIVAFDACTFYSDSMGGGSDVV